jgi:hypothetical protein
MEKEIAVANSQTNMCEIERVSEIEEATCDCEIKGVRQRAL